MSSKANDCPDESDDDLLTVCKLSKKKRKQYPKYKPKHPRLFETGDQEGQLKDLRTGHKLLELKEEEEVNCGA